VLPRLDEVYLRVMADAEGDRAPFRRG
jgi:hypothetical protein